jgi:hypothetical protein
MRRLLLFVVSVAMVVGGLYWVWFEVFWAAHVRGAFVAMGVLPATLGAYLLWIDFIAPWLGVKTGEG